MQRRIVALYLKAENTQESIAELFGCDQKTITNTIDNYRKNSTPGKSPENQFLYNIWNTPKQDNAVKHFGAGACWMSRQLRVLAPGVTFGIIQHILTQSQPAFLPETLSVLDDRPDAILNIVCSQRSCKGCLLSFLIHYK